MNQHMPKRLRLDENQGVVDQMLWIHTALINMRRDDVLKEIELNYPEVFNYE